MSFCHSSARQPKNQLGIFESRSDNSKGCGFRGGTHRRDADGSDRAGRAPLFLCMVAAEGPGRSDLIHAKGLSQLALESFAAS